MARRLQRVSFTLDPQNIETLDKDEIKAILRAADSIIFRGGRNLLSKILKGSKEKKVIELELDKNPAYGFYKSSPLGDVLARIDWMIVNRYLAIEYDGRLPLIVFAPAGWKIEMDTYTDEIIEGMEKMLQSGTDDYDMLYLKDKNRELIWLLIDKVQALEDPKFIPILKAWAAIDYKKVKKRLNQAIRILEQGLS